MSEEYYNGKKLYGDDFSFEQIKEWYNQEQEAYADLGSKNRDTYNYEYHEGNKLNGFRYLSRNAFDQVLGFGSAYGDEFLPILDKIKDLTILEPSDQLKSENLGRIIPKYVKPSIDGTLNFEDNTFDLITSFGVLHHVPNVSYVLSELIRVLKPGGYLMIKDPISTMGDWNKPRKGLTKNERGIPLEYFEKIFNAYNAKVVRRTLIDNSAVYKIINSVFPYSSKSKMFVILDRFFSKIFAWNYSYHRTKLLKKIAPGAVFYIVSK